MLLRGKPDMAITDPNRLLDLGRRVCTFLGEQRGNAPEIIGNVKSMLLQEGVSSSDGMHITAASITTLCPENKSKILPR